MSREIQFDHLWKYVDDHFQCGAHSFHGIDHWRRVWRNGHIIAERSGADKNIVELFSLFHDSCRLTEGTDPGHGARGAELAYRLRGEMFDLNDEGFDLLHYACTWHQDRDFCDDKTVGTCWDADRLDLGRVGVIPDPELLNTQFGKRLAEELNLEAALDELDNRAEQDVDPNA